MRFTQIVYIGGEGKAIGEGQRGVGREVRVGGEGEVCSGGVRGRGGRLRGD